MRIFKLISIVMADELTSKDCLSLFKPCGLQLQGYSKWRCVGEWIPTPLGNHSVVLTTDGGGRGVATGAGAVDGDGDGRGRHRNVFCSRRRRGGRWGVRPSVHMLLLGFTARASFPATSYQDCGPRVLLSVSRPLWMTGVTTRHLCLECVSGPVGSHRTTVTILQ